MFGATNGWKVSKDLKDSKDSNANDAGTWDDGVVAQKGMENPNDQTETMVETAQELNVRGMLSYTIAIRHQKLMQPKNLKAR